MPLITMGTNDTEATRQRTKCKGFLSGGEDKQNKHIKRLLTFYPCQKPEENIKISF